MRNLVALVCLLVPVAAHAGGDPLRAQIAQKFSKTAVARYDRTLRTGRAGELTPIKAPGYDGVLASRGFGTGKVARYDSAQIVHGQLSEISFAQRGDTSIVRNYRERSMLGGLFRVESTVGYKQTSAGRAVLGDQKRLVIGGFLKIPLIGDAKRIMAGLK
jgi:hypothetical protein